eukprot:3887762-Pleurochrysis_carterae.AAC.2
MISDAQSHAAVAKAHSWGLCTTLRASSSSCLNALLACVRHGPSRLHGVTGRSHRCRPVLPQRPSCKYLW